MRAKLSVYDVPIAGYLNIDPMPKVAPEYEASYNIARSNFTDIDKLLFDSECEEIIVNEVLSRLPCEQIYNFLALVAKKLSHKGRLVIYDTDLMSMVKGYLNGRLTTPIFNHVLFGVKTHPWGSKNSVVSASEIMDILADLQIIVGELSYAEPHTFIITGSRP